MASGVVETRLAVVELVRQWSVANSERGQGVFRVVGLLSAGFATNAGCLLSPCHTVVLVSSKVAYPLYIGAQSVSALRA